MFNPFSQQQQRKKTIYLTVILIIVILLIWFVVQRGILKRIVPVQEEIEEPRLVEIDFSVLKSPQVKELQPLEQILFVQEEIGRENPFIPF